MTEQSNAELTAEANKLLAENQWTSGWGVESLAERLAAALEAADQRAENAERQHRLSQKAWAETLSDRNQYAAVVEKVRKAIDGPHPANSGLDSYTLAHLSPLLDAAPADALRERDAALIEGLADEFAARLPDGTGNGRAYNSHTVARMLREKARQRREEHDRG